MEFLEDLLTVFVANFAILVAVRSFNHLSWANIVLFAHDFLMWSPAYCDPGITLLTVVQST